MNVWVIVIDKIKIRAVKVQDRPIRFTLSGIICSVIRKVFEREVVAGHLQKADMGAVVHLSVTRAVLSTLVKNTAILVLTTKFI